ncbi:MAG TPA: hypothetical protein VF529_11990 [Solirubrobacteraceae bacterium]
MRFEAPDFADAEDFAEAARFEEPEPDDFAVVRFEAPDFAEAARFEDAGAEDFAAVRLEAPDFADAARFDDPDAELFADDDFFAVGLRFAAEPLFFAFEGDFAELAREADRVDFDDVDESPPSRALPSRLLERRTGRERGRLEKTSPLEESSAIG